MALMKALAFVTILWTLPFCLSAQKNVLVNLLEQHPDRFGKVMANPDKYRVQIIYTQIDRDAQNRPTFNSYTYRVDPDAYFYPASTVKMPGALLALEKINKLQVIGLDRDAVMIHGAATAPQTIADKDSTSPSGLPTLSHYIRKLFIVSDNDAFNRIYEYLGQEYLTRRLWEKGYHSARITHRLAAPDYNPEANRYTNPVSYYHLTPEGKKGDLLYHQGEVYSKVPTTKSLHGEKLGNGYINGAGELVNEPFDFSWRNFIALQDLHDMVKAIMFPNDVPKEQSFRLSDSDRKFVWQCMSELPRESTYPHYPEKDYPDGYVKFFMFGDTKERIPDHIRIFNKVGNAYGFLNDAAYIVDFKNGVEFLLAATIHINENQIFNDGIYEYETIGYPFLAQLGRTIYAHELKRTRKNPPDLSVFPQKAKN
jgi:hypothetical protein